MLKLLLILIMPLFFHLLTNVHFQGEFVNKLYILSTFSNISLPFYEVHLIEGRRWTMNDFSKLTQIEVNSLSKLARALKNTFSPYFVFSLSLQQATKELFAFIKTTVYAFVISMICALFSIDWLTNFKGEKIWLISLSFTEQSPKYC